MTRWETTLEILVTSGALTDEQDKALLKEHDIRFVGPGEPPIKGYSQFCFVEAETAWDAYLAADKRVENALQPYGVEYLVYRSSANRIFTERTAE